MSEADRAPVIVGVGESIDRPIELANALEPAALIANALREADRDAGGGWLPIVERLDVVRQVSWPYADLPSVVARLIGHRPRQLAEGPVGGETPIRSLDEAAGAIARGEIAVAAICGGEAEHSAAAARRAGIALPWTQGDPGWTNPRARHYLHPLALRHGLSEPVFVYPLYDNAAAAAWGQTPGEALRESAALWSRLSRVAAANPASWLARRYTADEIATPAPANRPIAYPYTKLMVANPAVNQGAAVIVTSRGRARAAGLTDDRLIHVGAASAANEPPDWLSRDRFDHVPAQAAVLDAVLARAGSSAHEMSFVELYSCFPSVPKMAARTLGLPHDAVPSVTGGLTFFGAPLNNYMTHALAAMTRRLREAPGASGLLYGQGGFATRHHAIVLAHRPIVRDPETDSSMQPDADRRRGTIPAIRDHAEGSARLETHTVFYDRAGLPTRAAVVLRLPDGARTIARVAAADVRTLVFLTDSDRQPVGRDGHLSEASDGLREWRCHAEPA